MWAPRMRQAPTPAPKTGLGTAERSVASRSPLMRRRWVLALVTILLLPQSALADPLPASRRIDWTYAGVPDGIPNRTKICATITPADSASTINRAIARCSATGGGVVFLEAGTYNVEGINVDKDSVTLRGAGADRTVMHGCNIVNLGRGNNIASGVEIVGGGVKDSRTIVVSSLRGLSVNRMIEIDRDDDPGLVISTAGGSRHMAQVNMITGIRENVVTLRNPLIWDFSTGKSRIKWIFTNTRFSGVEDVKLDHSGTSGCTNFRLQYCYGCWLKGIHSHNPSSYHIIILATLNGEIRDSYISDAQTYGPNNGGLVFYGAPPYGSNSSWKIENNILNRVFPGIHLQNSSSAFYIGYNYGHAAIQAPVDGEVTWMFSDNHGPHDMMNLWEGNVGELMGSDGYYGSSSHGTILRNYLTGYNPIFRTVSDAMRLNRLAYYYNVIGNVLGSAGSKPRKYQEDTNGCRGGPAIFRLGYPNIGNCGLADVTGYPVPGMSYPDAKVAATLLRWGNYDYFHKQARFVPSEIPSGIPAPPDEVIPNSYYYSATPAWWPAGIAWPPIGPEVTGGDGDASGHVHKIPAQVCWEKFELSAGRPFNASACYAPASASLEPANRK